MIDDWSGTWVFKSMGALAGVLASLVIVAPESTKNALYRAIIGVVMGVIFSPATQNLVFFLDGDGLEHHLAAGAATGFTVWFILEGVARLLSSRDTVTRLLEELLRISGRKK